MTRASGVAEGGVRSLSRFGPRSRWIDWMSRVGSWTRSPTNTGCAGVDCEVSVDRLIDKAARSKKGIKPSIERNSNSNAPICSNRPLAVGPCSGNMASPSCSSLVARAPLSLEVCLNRNQ